MIPIADFPTQACAEFGRAGDPGLFQSGYFGSCRPHNKSFWQEADDRAHLATEQVNFRAADMGEMCAWMQFGPGALMYPLVTDMRRTLSRSGVPHDFYLLSDIGHRDMPDYKMYVFLNGFPVSPHLREAIRTKTRRNERHCWNGGRHRRPHGGRVAGALGPRRAALEDLQPRQAGARAGYGGEGEVFGEGGHPNPLDIGCRIARRYGWWKIAWDGFRWLRRRG